MDDHAPMPPQAQKIVSWLRDRLALATAKGFVVGLSGGIDSAVVARLCQLAAPASTLGVILPCHSTPSDEVDARLVAAKFDLPIVRIDLSTAYDTLTQQVIRAQAEYPAAAGATASPDIKASVPMANVKPRLRMASLYLIANSRNYLVAGTGNRSELMIGYFTKYGDGGVDLLPIGNLLKREVRALARELGVPSPIIDKPPSAGLWPGQTDEHEMGFTYTDLELYLEQGPDTISPALAMRIERLIRQSEHKRSMAPLPERPTEVGL